MYYLYLYNVFYILNLLIIFLIKLILNVTQQCFYLYINLNKMYTTQVIFEYYTIYWNVLFFNYSLAYCLIFIWIICFNYIWNYIVYTNWFVFYIFFCTYFLYFNYNNDTNFLMYIVNSLLINKINYIHPLLIYIFSSLWLINYLFFNYIINYIIFFKYYYKILIILFFIIILGCWWSYQEDMWNSWWVWEISEILNLIYILLILCLIHSSKLFNNIFYFINLKNIISLIIFINYNLIQIYLSDTSHNFINYYSLIFLYSYLLIYNLWKFYLIKLTLHVNLKNINFCNLFWTFCKIVFLIYILYYLYIYNYWHLVNQVNVLIFDLSYIIYISTYLYVYIFNFNFFKTLQLLYKHLIFFLILLYLYNTTSESYNLLNCIITYFNFKKFDNILFIHIYNEWNVILQYKWVFIYFLKLDNITNLNNIFILLIFSIYYIFKYNFIFFRIYT